MDARWLRRISRRNILKAGGLIVATIGLQRMANRLPHIAAQPRSGGGPTLAASLATDGPPDLILKNGQVYTMDAADTMAQAIAIKNGRIQAVASDQEIVALAAPTTQIIDVGGRVVTPGFIDPHLHFRAWGLQNQYYVPFLPPAVRDTATLRAALQDVVAATPAGEWILGYYLVMADKPIFTKEDLDPVSPNHPVFIMHIGGHWGTANSAALAVAGVTAATPSPQGGIIEKGPDGEPTGVFYNHRAMDVVRSYAPPITYEMVKSSILATQTLLAACGVTSFQDNNIRELEHIQAYQDLTQDGRLFLRNTLYLTLEWPADASKISQVQRINNEVTRFAGFKFLIDGQGPTAYCYEPHNGTEWRMPTWEPNMFKQAIAQLHNTGLQICVHCIGDAAADLVLEAYEGAMNANPRSDPRHRLEHVILTKPHTTQKIKDLGVVVSTNPAFVYLFGDGWENIFGSARMERIMVIKEWLQAGIHVTIGSDAPSTPFYTPQATLAGACTRQTYSQRVLGIEHRLTLAEALRAHTIEAAYAAHEEGVKGSLEPTKFADIVVWAQDPATMTMPQLFQTTTVYMTLVGGKIVYPQSYAFVPFARR